MNEKRTTANPSSGAWAAAEAIIGIYDTPVRRHQVHTAAAMIDRRMEQHFAEKYAPLVEACRRARFHRAQGNAHPVDWQRIEQALSRIES